ncbi:hypothetical protein FK515_28195, partial [Klebsiella pneumoniae]|nr:hypothetical protein [Klebsiella pneumoniae]
MRILILIYWALLAYDMVSSLVIKLIWSLFSALLATPYFGCHLVRIINNHTFFFFSPENQSMGKSEEGTFPYSFTFPFSFERVTSALENFEYPWDVQASILLLLCVLNGFQMLFRIKQLFTKFTRRSAWRLDGQGWHGMWEKTGRYLENFSPPMVWNFTPEQLQNPDEVIEYLKEKCHSYSKEAKLTALCWALASIYQTLLNVQHPQEEGRKNQPTDTLRLLQPRLPALQLLQPRLPAL